MPPEIANSNPATNLDQARQLYNRLQQQGMDAKQIERLIEQPGKLDEILRNQPLLAQYFRTAVRGLHEVTEWDFDNRVRAVAAEMPGPEVYAEYYHQDLDPGPILGQDYLNEELLQNPQQMVAEGYFTESQAKFYQKILDEGLWPPPPPMQSSGDNIPLPPAPVTKGSASTPMTKGLGSSTMPFPPPPPPPPGAYPGGASGAGYYPNVSPELSNYINTLQNGVARDMLAGLLGDMNLAHGVMGNFIMGLEKQRQRMRDLREMMGELDPDNPEELQKMNLYKMEMEEIGTSLREGGDKLQQAEATINQRKELVADILKTMNQTVSSIISNTRVS